jgi:hypothetical protein
MPLGEFALGSLISGGAGLLGSLFTSGQSRWNQDKQNKFNAEQARIDRDWRESMWNKENEYNTPTAQLARIRDAGLSPGLMYQNGGSFAEASVPSGSQARAAESQRQFFDPSVAVQMALQAMQIEQNVKTQKQQAKTSAAQEKVYEEEAEQKKEQTRGTKLSNDITEASKDDLIISNHYKAEYDKLISLGQEHVNERFKWQAEESRVQYETAEKNFQYLVKEKDLNIQKITQEIENMKNLAIHQCKLMDAQTVKAYCDAAAAKAQELYYRTSADKALIETVPSALKMYGEYKDKINHAKYLAKEGKLQESKNLLIEAQEGYYNQMTELTRNKKIGQDIDNNRKQLQYTSELFTVPLDLVKKVFK